MVFDMKNTVSFAGLVGFVSLVVACSGSSSSDDAVLGKVNDEVRIDIACSTNTDCPTGFECESETENGVTTSFCKSHGGAKAPDQVNGQTLECETEVEHGVTKTECKPHGGDDADDREHASGEAENEQEHAAETETETETEHADGGAQPADDKGGGGKGGKGGKDDPASHP